MVSKTFYTRQAMNNLTALTYWSTRGCLQIRTISSKTLGNCFEVFTVNALRKYCFDLWLCGGPKDRGIDFRGVWKLKARTVNILGQCKCYKRRLGPVHVRELEGALSHEHKDSLGLLVTSIGFTKNAYEHFMSSSYPIVLMVLDKSFIHMPLNSINSLEEWPCPYTCQQLNISHKNEENCTQITCKTELVKHHLHDAQSNTNCKVVDWKTQRVTQDGLNDDVNNQISDKLSVFGEMPLFELNITARHLLPDVVIGRTLKTNKFCSPVLLSYQLIKGNC